MTGSRARWPPWSSPWRARRSRTRSKSIVSWFGNFTAAHGFAVNLVAVLALALVGAGLSVAAVRGDARLARVAVIAGAVFCLADWVLVEDLGFFGGLGTDPNSMIPFILLFTAGYLGLAPRPPRATAGGGRRTRRRPTRGRRALRAGTSPRPTAP